MDFKKFGNRVGYLSKKAKKSVSFKIIFILCLIVICWQFWGIKKEIKAAKKDAAQARIYAVAAGARSYSSSSNDDLESRVDDLESKLNGIYGLEYKVSSLESHSHSDLERKIRSLEYDTHSH